MALPPKPTLIWSYLKNVILSNSVTTLKRHLTLPLKRRQILILGLSSKRIVPLLISLWSKFNSILNIINSLFFVNKNVYSFSLARILSLRKVLSNKVLIRHILAIKSLNKDILWSITYILDNEGPRDHS